MFFGFTVYFVQGGASSSMLIVCDWTVALSTRVGSWHAATLATTAEDEVTRGLLQMRDILSGSARASAQLQAGSMACTYFHFAVGARTHLLMNFTYCGHMNFLRGVFAAMKRLAAERST
jgi:hypothetical protein